MLRFATFKAASTLDEDVETLSELALVVARAVSRLVDEVERLIEDAWLIEMFAFANAKAASMLEEEDDRLNELVLRAASVPSTLEEECDRLRLET